MYCPFLIFPHRARCAGRNFTRDRLRLLTSGRKVNWPVPLRAQLAGCRSRVRNSLSVPFKSRYRKSIVCGEQFWGGLFGGASHDSNRESRAFWPFMWLSTLWIGISVALSTGGHPTTAVLPLAAWIAHRRTEKRKFGRVNKCVRTLKDLQIGKAICRPGT